MIEKIRQSTQQEFILEMKKSSPLLPLICTPLGVGYTHPNAMYRSGTVLSSITLSVAMLRRIRSFQLETHNIRVYKAIEQKQK